jgi:hypothetical protein
MTDPLKQKKEAKGSRLASMLGITAPSKDFGDLSMFNLRSWNPNGHSVEAWPLYCRTLAKPSEDF